MNNLQNNLHRVPSGYEGIWFTLGQFSEFGDKYSGTTKLTRRRKPERRELATKAQAVGGRVQRLVLTVLVGSGG